MADWQSLGDRAEKQADKSAPAFPVLLQEPHQSAKWAAPATNSSKSVLQEVELRLESRKCLSAKWTSLIFSKDFPAYSREWIRCNKVNRDLSNP